MIDAITFTRGYGVKNSADLDKKLLECRKQINSCKKAINRLEQELHKEYNNCLFNELKKYKNNLQRFRMIHGHLMKVKEPIKEIIQERYNYRTELFVNPKNIISESKNKSVKTADRNLAIDQQIAMAEKQKKKSVQNWNYVKEYEER